MLLLPLLRGRTWQREKRNKKGNGMHVFSQGSRREAGKKKKKKRQQKHKARRARKT